MITTFLATTANANTRATYQRGLTRFTAWADANGVTLAELRPRDVAAYVDTLLAEVGPRSANTYLSAVRAFLRWAARYEYLPLGCYQAAVVVENAKTPERLPTVLSSEAAEELLCKPDPATFSGARDLAFIALLLSSGIRLSEAVTLDLDALDLARLSARVVGKGDRERVVFFDADTAAAIRHYLHLRADRATTGPLFINTAGGRITGRSLQTALAAYGLHPHTLRHTFATELLDASGDIDAVSRLLGHRQVTTTQIYTQTATKRLEAVYRSANNQKEAATDNPQSPEPRRHRSTAGTGANAIPFEGARV